MLQVSRYESKDRDVVYALHEAGMEQVGASFGPGPWDDDLRNIEGVYLNGTGEFLVGKLDETIVAMGALRFKAEGVGEIKRLRVLPKCQRKGFGRLLLELLEKRAEELGYHTIVLDTTEKQIPAQRLYEAFDYKEVRRKPFKGAELIFYEKRLPLR